MRPLLIRARNQSGLTDSRSTTVPVLIRHRPTPKSNQPYHEERGWTKQGDTFTGYFRTPQGQWAGRVRRKGNGQYEFVILDPPESLRDHPKWICFHHIGRNAWRVHFHGDPGLNDGIIAMEQLLYESFHKCGDATTVPFYGTPTVIRGSRTVRYGSEPIIDTDILSSLLTQPSLAAKKPSPMGNFVDRPISEWIPSHSILGSAQDDDEKMYGSLLKPSKTLQKLQGFNYLDLLKKKERDDNAW